MISRAKQKRNNTWLPLLLLGPLLASPAGTDAATLESAPLTVTPVVNRSAKILSLSATFVSSTQECLVYPLLKGMTTNASSWGEMPEGEYVLGFEFRLSSLPDALQCRWQPSIGSATGTDLPGLTDLSLERWYQAAALVTITGGTWQGNVALALSCTSRTGTNSVTVLFDNFSLRDTNGLDFIQPPSDFETLNVGTNFSNAIAAGTGQLDVFEVRDHLEWQTLPGWFESNRVHLHTRLASRANLDPAFYTAENLLRDYGFTSAMNRWVKSRNQGPYWPTSFPLTNPPPPGAWPDPYVGFVDTAGSNIVRAHAPRPDHAPPMKEISYYYMMSESNVLATWPEWACRDKVNNLVTNNTSGSQVWYNLCNNSPYRPKVVRERLAELAAKHPDGIFFDEKHNAEDGCWCAWCKARFEPRYGPLPTNDTYNTPQWINLLNFYNLICRDSFVEYQAAIHSASPETVAIISTTFTASLWDPRARSEFAGIVQSAKYEFSSAWGRYNTYLNNNISTYVAKSNRPSMSSFNTCGWALVRDAAQGRMPHIWIDNDPGRHADTTNYTKTATEMYVAASFFLGLGCIANVDIVEAHISSGQLYTNLYQPVVKLGERFGPKLAGARPLKWTGIHFSDRARDNIYRGTTNSAVTLGRGIAWSNLLSTIVFAYEGLQIIQPILPATLVTDAQLERGEIDDLQYLFLPSNDLTPAMQFAVSNFQAAGRTVIRQADHPEWNWKNVVTRTDAVAGLRAALGAATQAPAQVSGGLDVGAPRIFSGFFEQQDGLGNRRLLVSVCNDFSWLYDTNLSDPVKTSYYSLPPGLPSGGLAQVSGARALFRQLRRGANFRYYTDNTPGQEWQPLTALTTNGTEITAALPSFNNLALIEVQMPAPPEFAPQLSAQAITSRRIDLSWSSASTNALGFRLERALGENPFTPLTQLAEDSNSFSDKSLVSETVYRYRICATNLVGDSPFSNIATATTPGLVQSEVTASLSSGAFLQLGIAGETNETYQLLFSTNLVEWDYMTNWANISGLYLWSNQIPSAPGRGFYRVKLYP